MSERITVSTLGKSWILDLDGTIVKHNGCKIDGKDTFLAGAKEFLQKLPEKDLVVFVTSRPKELAEETEGFLRENGARYDTIVYGAPYGERILVNDAKPSGLPTAIAITTKRDEFLDVLFEEDETL